MKITSILLLITTTFSGLVAGLFYAWSVSVMPGLKVLPSREFVPAMQSMNRAILNPLFFVCFLGTVLMFGWCMYVHFSNPVTLRFWFLFVAALLYIICVIGITAMGNVPLNNTLDAFNMSTADITQLETIRASFERPWNRLNAIRTIGAILSFIFTIAACLAIPDPVTTE